MLIILNVIWNIFQDYQIFHDALNKTYKQNFILSWNICSKYSQISIYAILWND